jgi:hypothetical protein
MENFLPVKSELYENNNLIIQASFKNYRLNKGIPDNVFEFSPPNGSIILDPDKNQPQILKLEKAKDKVDFAVKAPTYLPENYERDIVQYIPDSSSILTYSHG